VHTGQTLWFILQVIVRGVVHLPITELELVTVAYSLLNLFTYVLWPGKPLHVQCGIPIPLKVSPETPQDEIVGEETRRASGMRLAFAMITRISEPIDRFIRILERLDIPKTGIWSTVVHNIWLAIKNAMLLPIPRLIVGGYNMGLSDRSNNTRVPTFYAGTLTDFQGLLCTAVATTVAAAVFGRVHCIACRSCFRLISREYCGGRHLL
jgi:hypothetical protein